MALSEVSEKQKASWILCCQCSAIVSLLEERLWEILSNLVEHPAKCWEAFGSHLGLDIVLDQRLSSYLDFLFSHSKFEGVGSTGEILENLEWSSCPLFSSTMEKKKCLVWTFREFPSVPLSLAMMWQSGLSVWRLLP